MLAKKVASEYDGKVVFRVEDFGDSPVADKLGVDKYPAIFIASTQPRRSQNIAR